MFSCLCCYFFFFFKQKPAYDMRISDWSSDVCSSDLEVDDRRRSRRGHAARQIGRSRAGGQSAGVKGALSPSLAGARGGSTKRPAQCRQFFALTQKGSLRSLPTPHPSLIGRGNRKNGI